MVEGCFGSMVDIKNFNEQWETRGDEKGRSCRALATLAVAWVVAWVVAPVLCWQPVEQACWEDYCFLAAEFELSPSVSCFFELFVWSCLAIPFCMSPEVQT